MKNSRRRRLLCRFRSALGLKVTLKLISIITRRKLMYVKWSRGFPCFKVTEMAQDKNRREIETAEAESKCRRDSSIYRWVQISFKISLVNISFRKSISNNNFIVIYERRKYERLTHNTCLNIRLSRSVFFVAKIKSNDALLLQTSLLTFRLWDEMGRVWVYT